MAKRAFTDEQVEAIQHRLMEGETTKDLAEEFRVSTTTIKNVRRNLYKAKSQYRKTGPQPKPLADRLWEKIEVGQPGECWPWKGASRKGSGVPTIGVGGGKNQTAYRALFELEHRPLEKGENVLHSCRNPICMNPSHLYTGNKYDWARQFQKGDIDHLVISQNAERSAERARAYYQEHKEVMKRKSSAYQLERKLAAVIYKGGTCLRCGEAHPAALQFHHRDPETKVFAVSSKALAAPKKYDWNTIRAELDKCDCLCANCHSKHHSKWDEDLVTLKRQTVLAYGAENILSGTL